MDLIDNHTNWKLIFFGNHCVKPNSNIGMEEVYPPITLIQLAINLDDFLKKIL